MIRGQCYEMIGDAEKARQDSWRARVFADR